ncbi:MAG: DEAD/DEAH box helicase, partial [Chloroflexi bacterium]|nr:DEAD/DEAH box helicase [Chloroflexota bacterium]
MPLSHFHPLVQQWFKEQFPSPTPAQTLGWNAIAQGRSTLIAAPTGSGKTLAAFLLCLDRLVRSALNDSLPVQTEVVYVSPLKALSNDIHKNLMAPLHAIARLADEADIPLPEVRVAVRTGDTLASERQAMAKRPPHILITTPESLYILLTSESGRRGLTGVRTLILDEVHAVVGTKRGSHLSLSVERLCRLADGPVTRIGLSATQQPIEEVARFLVGANQLRADGAPDCAIVDTGHARAMDLSIEMPPGELGPIATQELWAHTLDRAADLVRQHRTTLLFTNTRRLVERIAHQMSQRLGEAAVVAHHGSLSRKTRHAAEQKLKEGEAKLCVATASLELGIDIGAIDLVCQMGSPRSIGLLLQRVGRSGHAVTAMPKGRLFPLTRDELIESLALLRAVRLGNLDRLRIPPWPLDVLAQQVVAACASEPWQEQALFELCRTAYPYRELPRERFEQVIETLSNGIAGRQGRTGAYLHRDAVNGMVRARRSARLAAITSGGAIPDNADYDVIADPEDTFVGTVNEDFAVESLPGDVFLLGNTSWRIRRVEKGKVRVEDAKGAPTSVPFWLGEAPGRTTELSAEVSQLREEIDSRLDQPEAAKQWVIEETSASPEAAAQAVAYLAEGKRVLGFVPTQRRIIAERFFDESGGMQLVIHSPFGARINKAWGLSLRKQFCRTFDFELQASATDDGINLSLGPQHSLPLEEVFNYLSPKTVEQVALQAVLRTPIFATRWRWDATRFLAVLRYAGGRKVPPPLLRMRSDDLLAAAFPAQVACQDNMRTPNVDVPDHPLVFETVRDCLTEAMDIEGLKALLAAMERGDVQLFARDTPQPSVFAHQILNAMPYAFLDDAPLEERRARAVSLRRALPEDARDLGSLDPEAVRMAADDAWPLVRDAEELHDALLTLGVLPERIVHTRAEKADEQWHAWFDELAAQKRATRLLLDGGTVLWVAAEKVADAAIAYPKGRLSPVLPPLHRASTPASEEDAVAAIVRGWVESSGPFTVRWLAETLSLSPSAVEAALLRLESEGLVLRGRFTPGQPAQEFCDRRVLARIHQMTIAKLRQEIEPVSQAAFLRFLFRWQQVAPATAKARGEEGLLETIEQLQGFEAAAGAWESGILPARVEGYLPSMLDRLCFSGEVAWGRFTRRPLPEEATASRAPLSRTGPISLALRDDLPWLLDERPAELPALTGTARDVLEFLSRHGASFAPDIVSGTRRLPAEVEDALWQLVAAGQVTADGFDALRGLISGSARRIQRRPRFRRVAARRLQASRWSLL